MLLCGVLGECARRGDSLEMVLVCVFAGFFLFERVGCVRKKEKPKKLGK